VIIIAAFIIEFIICGKPAPSGSYHSFRMYFTLDVFTDLGTLPSICKRFLPLDSAPITLKIVGGAENIKPLCERIDISQFGKDMLKLSLMDAEEKGLKMKTVEEFLPMFHAILKVLRPVRDLPGLPDELQELVHKLKDIDEGKTTAELFEVTKRKEVYETMYKYMMTVRIQESLRGMHYLYHHFESNWLKR
jgi:hypothetical protein